jgi:four helix bundle protein
MNESNSVIIWYHDYLKALMPVVEKFPRSYRFVLGERLLTVSFDILERIIEAYYRKEKLESLNQANLGLEKLRHFLRMSYEMQIIGIKPLERLLTLMDEVGRMIGGWIKKVKKQSEEGE